MEAGMIQTLTRLGIVLGMPYVFWLAKIVIYFVGWLQEPRPRCGFLYYYDDSDFDSIMLGVTCFAAGVALVAWIISPVFRA